MLTLSNEDKRFLLSLARQAIMAALSGQSVESLAVDAPKSIMVSGASFVTLTKHGALRGCIGALKAYQPLMQDVCEHAVAAALEDYRFRPVKKAEMDQIEIEISCLTEAQPLAYTDSDDLIIKLRPGIDGVILKDGLRQATFLPQVWEQLPDPKEFLSHLCSKMGARVDAWKTQHLTVDVYQVFHFSESEYGGKDVKEP